MSTSNYKTRGPRNEMRIPERDATYIVSSVYLLTLIHRYQLNRKQIDKVDLNLNLTSQNIVQCIDD